MHGDKVGWWMNLSPLLLQVEKELAFASQKLFGKPAPVPDVEDCGRCLERSLLCLQVWAPW